MEIPTKQELLTLTEAAPGPHVSICLPTHRAGPDTRQDPIRLKNLIAGAEAKLLDWGMGPTDVRRLLRPLSNLVDDYDFWQHQSDGLAIFLRRDEWLRYRVPLTLPELVVVGPHFHLKPLLPLLSADAIFWVLAISSNDLRLLECTPYSQDEVGVEGLPRSLATVLWNNDPQKDLQFRSFTTGAAGNTVIFHGAGGSELDVKDDLLNYFRGVDRVLTPHLSQRGGPLILACVEYLAPIYRDANSYAGLVQGFISGSPDEAPADRLREAGWRLLEPSLVRTRDDAADRYRSLVGTGLTTQDPAEAALAAVTGRIDTMFVTVGIQHWGRVDIGAHVFERHGEAQPGDYDLLDLSALRSLAAGGTVFAVDLSEAPEPSGVAAIFRY